MTRIAYVDHSYHKVTRSTMFLPELLSARGHQVDIFWDEAWIGGKPVRWQTVAGYDVVIMFQSYCPTDGSSFRSLHPNVVYIPMFDQFDLSPSVTNGLASFWTPFLGSKVLSFSTAVHTLASGFGLVSHVARYYPEVQPRVSHARDGLHGFFWLRREGELGWDVIRALVGATRFDSFHLHVAGDPGFPPVQLPRSEDLRAYNITISTWFDRRADFDEIACRANVYFAPRLAEGIGQTFLEAMGRGQCVIAADNPTMNEYIVHGVNGLLYEPRVPSALDFSDVARLGQEARRGAVAGGARWEQSEESLVDFILTPSAALYGDRVATTRARATGDKNDIERRPVSTMVQSARSLARTLKAAVQRHVPG